VGWTTISGRARYFTPTGILFDGHWGPFAGGGGVKWPGRETDHSPPASAKDKKVQNASTPPHALLA
jgi:hypothetical protein